MPLGFQLETGPKDRFLNSAYASNGLSKSVWRGWMGIEPTWDGYAPPHRQF